MALHNRDRATAFTFFTPLFGECIHRRVDLLTHREPSTGRKCTVGQESHPPFWRNPSASDMLKVDKKVNAVALLLRWTARVKKV
jgi:hypothetical protein